LEKQEATGKEANKPFWALLQDVKVEKNEQPDEESFEGKTTNGVF
jgi:hypothetical protein